MSAPDLDDIRLRVLDRMERSDRLVKWAILVAAALEAVLLVTILLVIDRGDPVQRLLLLLFLLNYSVTALGLVALGGHVSRSVGRLLQALEPPARR